jgi:TP53 regulating kinase-like protein
MEKLLVKGAEADIYETEWYEEPAISKIRVSKSYRLQSIDQHIRKTRTYHEALQLHRAKAAGVLTPFIYLVDGKNFEIIMEKVEGSRFKELLGKEERVDESMLEDLGISLRKLHEASIIHGDPTPSNYFLSPNSEIVFLDFGLSYVSQRTEDMADDLHLLKTVLTAEFAKRGPFYFKKILEGYGQSCKENKMKAIENQIKSIERRGRYARVD